MIAYIRGTLAEKDTTRAVIEAAGVGYEILIPISTFERLPREGAETKLLVAHCVREDDEILFGFATPAEKEMFGLLTAVPGVGPKIALAILSGSSVAELSLAVASGNARRLSAIKGVGRKTAEKICLELKDKVNPIAAQAAAGAAGSANGRDASVLRDAILALSALGFNEETANGMVTKVLAGKPDVKGTEEIVRLALSVK